MINKMKAPWKKLKSKIVHKNPWYQVREDDVLRPDGDRGKYYLVDGTDSVAVVAEDPGGKIYLVGQSRYPVGNIYSWEIITGGLKKGMNPLKKAKEELQEEAGLKARQWIKLGYCYPVNGYAAEKCHVYLARGLQHTKTSFEATEDIEIKKEKLEKIIEMIRKNEITCGITVFSIGKYLIYKRLLNL